MSDSVFKLAWACRCLVAMTCFASSGWVAVNGSEGWGWLVFVGLLVTPFFSFVDRD